MKMKRFIILLSLLAVLLAAGSCRQPFETFLANHGFLTFELLKTNNSVLSTDVRGGVLLKAVNLYVPPGTDRTNLIPSFTFLGQRVTVDDLEQVSGVTAHDFSSPVDYIVTAWNGSETTYTVSVLDIPPRVWAKTLSSVPGAAAAYFYDVAVDSAGNVYAVGYQDEQDGSTYGYEDDITADGPNGNMNAIIVKYSSDGTTLWARTVQTASDHTVFNAVAVDSSGNIYAAGYQNGTADVYYDADTSAAGSTAADKNAVLVKYDSSGNALWAASVTGVGTAASEFKALAVDSSGDVYAGGYQDNTGEYIYGGAAVIGTSWTNAVLVKYDSDGIGQWASSTVAGTVFPEGRSYFESIQADSSSNVYAAGYQFIEFNASAFDFYYSASVICSGYSERNNGMLVAYDGATGTAQWASEVGHSSLDGDSYFRGVSEADGSLYVIGDLKVDSAYSVNYDFGNGVIVQGGLGLDIEDGRSYAILVKYDSAGLAQWARYPDPGPSDSSFRGVAADPSGTIHAVGYQSLNGVYTYGPGVTASGGGESTNNAVLVSYDADGTALEALSVSCSQSGTSEHYAVAAGTGGDVYAAGMNFGSMGPLTYSYPTFSGDPAEATGANEFGPNVVLVKYGALP